MTRVPLLFIIELTLNTDEARLLRKLLDLGLTLHLGKVADSRPALHLVCKVVDKMSLALTGDVGRYP